MKKGRVLMVLFFLLTKLSFGQIKVGQSAGNISIPHLLNTKSKVNNLSQLKGKVVWLEFWATWCSPCVEAMPHLQELQKTYGGKLQVIAISMESEKRIMQFLTNRPSNLWFAMDSADLFLKPFPYRVIPHSVLIDATGTVVAITEPENITKQVIADVLAGKKINLPLKEDNMTTDPWSTYFSISDTVKSLFNVQPGVDGLPTGDKIYPKGTIFNNRRISMLNVPLELAYRIAYDNWPYDRTIDSTATGNSAEGKKKYCIDVVVPQGKEAELMPTLIKELKAHFDLQTFIEKKTKQVYVLSIADSAKVKMLNRSGSNEETLSGGGGQFSGIDIQLAKIAEYLEGYGVVRIPVVDETRDTNRYDIAFTYMPEKNGDLEQTLSNLGLQLQKQEREINILVFK